MTSDSSRIAERQIAERQMAAGFRWLRFDYGLEYEFRQYYFASGRSLRITLVCASTVILLLVTALDHQLLGTPPELDAVAHPLQRFITLPAFLLILFFSINRDQRLASDRTLLAGALLLTASVLSQRVIGARYGFDVPVEFTAVIISAVFFLGRIPFALFIPAVMIMTAAMLTVELWLVQPEQDGWYRVGVACTMILLSCLGGYFFEYAMRDVWLKRQILENQAAEDPLTGLPNRRAFKQVADRALRAAQRADKPLALAILDVDFFKAYNDTKGHSAGDECLCAIADLIRNAPRRPLDYCGRYGGEEFIIAWYGASREEAMRMAREVCMTVEARRIAHPASRCSSHVTVSIGVAVADGFYPDDPQQLVDQADGALYEAKRLGRNQVQLAGESPQGT